MKGAGVELRQLEHFVAVAEERSFTRAAARVHVVQSAVSVSVRSLERELGARLFDRTTQRVGLTDAGQAMLGPARRTLTAAASAREAVQEARGGLTGTLRLGIMQSMGLVDLAGMLTRFHRERPGVRIVPRPANGGSLEMVEQVAQGRLDLAFVGVAGEDAPGLVAYPLAAEAMQLACISDHRFAGRRRVDLAEAVSEPFVDAPTGWGTRRSTDRLLADRGLRREVTVEVPDVSTLVELVRAGLGLAILPPSLLRGGDGLHLCPVRPAPVFEVTLVAPELEQQSAATRAFVELVLRPGS
jgi:DNA-binding transcriptional LysR family regulator